MGKRSKRSPTDSSSSTERLERSTTSRCTTNSTARRLCTPSKGRKTNHRQTHAQRETGRRRRERESACAVGRIKAPGSARCVSKFYQSTWHSLLFACYRSFFVPLPSLRQLQLLIRVNLETQTPF